MPALCPCLHWQQLQPAWLKLSTPLLLEPQARHHHSSRCAQMHHFVHAIVLGFCKVLLLLRVTLVPQYAYALECCRAFCLPSLDVMCLHFFPAILILKVIDRHLIDRMKQGFATVSNSWDVSAYFHTPVACCAYCQDWSSNVSPISINLADRYDGNHPIWHCPIAMHGHG